MIVLFIYQGAVLDSQDREHRTPLTLAASKQAWKTVKLLLTKGWLFISIDIITLYTSSIDVSITDLGCPRKSYHSLLDARTDHPWPLTCLLICRDKILKQ